MTSVDDQEQTDDGTLYASGNYAPVQDEVTVFDLEVTGRIPTELSGRLLRNGPNPVGGIPDPVDYHWFTGTGMLHGVRLRDGKAEWYRNRFVKGSDVVAERGGPPVPGPSKGFDLANNTNILRAGGDLLALTEAGALPMLISYELETDARTDFGGTIGDGFTAHPRTDPRTGETHAVTYNPEFEKVQYQVVTTEGRVRHIVDVPVAGPPMVHDMGLTATYALILDLPVTISPAAARAGELIPVRWDPDHGARVGLLPRDGGAEDVIWCELPTTPYVFHTGNAYDAPDGTVVLDVVRYESMFVTNRRSPLADPSHLYRWTIDPRTRRVTETLLDDHAQEFPRHDERRVSEHYRYSYSITADDMPQGFTGLLKYDLQRGTSERVDYGHGRLTMETVFVPSSDRAEDDGWLMAYVHDPTTQRCDVVIRHAQDLGDPVATIHLPVRVPFGFHGNWIGD